jgi:hypothetical protein
MAASPQPIISRKQCPRKRVPIMKIDLLIVVHSERHIQRRLKCLARFKTVTHSPPLQQAQNLNFLGCRHPNSNNLFRLLLSPYSLTATCNSVQRRTLSWPARGGESRKSIRYSSRGPSIAKLQNPCSRIPRTNCYAFKTISF